MPAPPLSPPEWHPSFRYFRLSQTTDDLSDAFRNLYLAIESILSTATPQKLKPNGVNAEGDKRWFRRALAELGSRLDLSPFAPIGTEDLVDELVDEIYGSWRTSVFHAKAGRPVLVPLTENSRLSLSVAVQRVGRLYLAIAEEVLGIRYMSSSFGSAMVAAMASVIANNELRIGKGPMVERDGAAGQGSDRSP